MSDRADLLDDVRRGMIPAHIYNDQDVFDLEKKLGDYREAAQVSAGREDLLRRTDDGWKLARRTILVDDSVIRMQNLAVFL